MTDTGKGLIGLAVLGVAVLAAPRLATADPGCEPGGSALGPIAIAVDQAVALEKNPTSPFESFEGGRSRVPSMNRDQLLQTFKSVLKGELSVSSAELLYLGQKLALSNPGEKDFVRLYGRDKGSDLFRCYQRLLEKL